MQNIISSQEYTVTSLLLHTWKKMSKMPSTPLNYPCWHEHSKFSENQIIGTAALCARGSINTGKCNVCDPFN